MHASKIYFEHERYRAVYSGDDGSVLIGNYAPANVNEIELYLSGEAIGWLTYNPHRK